MIAFLIITPVFVSYLLNVMVSIGDTLGNMGYTDGQITQIGPIDRCLTGRDIETLDWVKQLLGYEVDTSYLNKGCVTVGYGFIGDHTDLNAKDYDRYHKLMKILAK